MVAIPENIQQAINQIKESEDKWKAYFMATWGLSYQIEGQYGNIPLWETPLKLGLPASKNKYHEYTPKRLHEILTTRDPEISIVQTQFLFSQLEDLVKQVTKTFHGKEIKADDAKTLKKFLKENGFLQNSEENEFDLAKETRNCFIHRNNKIDQTWVNKFKGSKWADTKNCKDGDRIPIGVIEVEEWTWLIVEIAKRIEEFLLNSSSKSEFKI